MKPAVPPREARPVPPHEVRLASACLLGMGVILLLNAGLALVYRSDIAAAADEDTVALLSPETIDVVIVVVGFLLLVIGTLLVLAGIHIQRGRQWARVLAFITAGIVIVFAAIAALAGGGLLAVFMLGAAVGAVSFLMQGAVNPFFAAGGRP